MTDVKELKTGTTTVGIICKDAVIIGTDKKATMGYMVESKEAQKIHQLDSHIGITIAGSVADAQAVVRILKAQFKLYRLERGAITLKGAANLLSNILHGNRYYPFMNQFILAGFDTVPHVYSFDPVGAFDEKDKFYSTGSGSPFVYGVLESAYKEGLSKEEGIALVVKCIKAAIQRDIASGGNGLLISFVDKDGYHELSDAEIKKYM